MTFEKQVCSLELAKKLKELGVKQESYFVWKQLSNQSEKWRVSLSDIHVKDYHGELISAFTVAELGEMLPHHIHLEGKNYQIEIWSGSDVKDVRFWSIGYNNYGNKSEFVFGANTESDARAKMLIYLLENKLITL